MMRVKGFVEQLFNVPSLDPSGRRRARLLNILVFGTAAIAFFAVIATVCTAVLGIEESRGQTFVIVVACLAVLAGAAAILAVNRYWSGQLASWLFLLLLTVAFAFSDKPQEVISGRTTFMFAVPILMASALLRPSASFLMAGLVGVLLTVIAASAKLPPDLFAVLGFFAIAMVSWLSARSLERVLDDLHVVNRELNVLYQSGRLFSSSLNLEQVFDIILEGVQSLLNATSGSIWLRDPQTSALVCRKQFDANGAMPHAHWMARTKRIVDQVARTGESVITVETNGGGNRFGREDPQTERDGSPILCAPLSMRGEVLGVIKVERQNKSGFEGRDLRLLESLAVDAIIAIENARLYDLSQQEIAERKRVEEALRRRNQELALLYRAGQVFSSSLDMDEVMVTVLREAYTLLGVTVCSVWLTDPDSGELVCRQSIGPHADTVRGWRLPPGQGLAGWVAQYGQSLIVPDAKTDGRHFGDIDKQTGWGVRSVLSVPLRVRAEVIGVLEVVDSTVNRFKQSDLTIIESLAASASIAIDNARLVEGLEGEVRSRTTEIRAEKEKNEVILTSVTDAIGVIDPHMRFRYVNPAFTDLTGHRPEEILGQSIVVLTATAPPGEMETRGHTFAISESWKGELIVRRRDGRTYEAMMTIAPMHDGTGDLIGYVTSHWDISQHKELERARTQFITNVSHELRTPLTNLRLYVELLKKEPQTEKSGRYLHVLEVQTRVLIRLTEDILELTALDSGQAVTLGKPIFLPSLIQAVVTGYRPQAEASGIDLEIILPTPAPPAIEGDQGRLAQALDKLLDNALRFTPAGGRVTVGAKLIDHMTRRWITVTVQDTGPGIAPEEQEHIFERFYRGSLAESGSVRGTGLGLCIAQSIVQAHGGRVTVDSRMGEGSTFSIWLPLST